ncbi:MAG: NUDIX domain-containing protein [Candidatus Hermodarchaeota archaeon]|nr:NUDIX domain-containing protein [Candidatus Hermodarchaeota archaeon]
MTGRIVPCVGAVILDKQDRVLLVKHGPEKKGFWAGKFICPGGRLDPGESLEDGVRREVREETGLEIRILHWVRPMERIIRDSDGSLLDHIVYLDVVAKVTQGDFEPASDVGEGAWFAKEDLTKIRNEIHEDTQRLLTEAGLLPKL